MAIEGPRDGEVVPFWVSCLLVLLGTVGTSPEDVAPGSPGFDSRLAAKGWNPLMTLRGVPSRWSLIFAWLEKCWSNDTNGRDDDGGEGDPWSPAGNSSSKSLLMDPRLYERLVLGGG